MRHRLIIGDPGQTPDLRLLAGACSVACKAKRSNATRLYACTTAARASDSESNVRFPAGETEITTVRDELDDQPGVTLQESCRRTSKQTVDKDRHRGDAHRTHARVLVGSDHLANRPNLLLHGFRMTRHDLTGRCQRHRAVCLPLHKLCLQDCLQGCEPARYRRVIDAELPRGRGQSSATLDGEQVAKVVPIYRLHDCSLKLHLFAF